MTPVDVQAAQESFQTPLVVEYVDGRDWIVLTEFVYVSPRIVVHVPAQFETDFASIPRFMWRVISPTELHVGKPAVMHDFLYRTPGVEVTRKFADQELQEAMKCVGAPWWKRQMVYRAVRIGGGGAWKERRG